MKAIHLIMILILSTFVICFFGYTVYEIVTDFEFFDKFDSFMLGGISLVTLICFAAWAHDRN